MWTRESRKSAGNTFSKFGNPSLFKEFFANIMYLTMTHMKRFVYHMQGVAPALRSLKSEGCLD
jgi:hypothetical protein